MTSATVDAIDIVAWFVYLFSPSCLWSVCIS